MVEEMKQLMKFALMHIPCSARNLIFSKLLSSNFYGMDCLLYRLWRAGLKPENIVDVGAHNGVWSKMAAQYFPSARYFLIDALSEKADILANCLPKEICFEYHICLLGREEKPDVPFYVGASTSSMTGSSMYLENTFENNKFLKRKILQTTLDNVVPGNVASGRNLLKLDVQGAELDVLSGAAWFLGTCDVIILEISIVEYNLGAPSYLRVLNELEKLGFILYDIGPIMRLSSGQMSQADVVVVRRSSSLWANGLCPASL